MLAEHEETAGGRRCRGQLLGDRHLDERAIRGPIHRICLGAGGSIRSNGELCINFPVAGYQCIDIDG